MTRIMLREWIKKLGEKLSGGSRRSRRQRTGTASRRATTKLTLDILEDRVVPTAYTWAGSTSAGGSWDSPSNWSPNTGYPHLSGDTATFASNVTGGTITLNGQEMVSSLASYGNLTFAAGSVGGSLWLGGSLSVSGGNPVFSVPMVLTSNLTLSNGAYDSFSITGPITQSGGSYGITANLGTNGDTITLTGANSLTGPLIVNGPGTGANGALDASPAGLGSESVTINSNANFAAVGDTPTFTNNITFDGTAQTLSGSEVKWTGNIANNTSTSLTINGGSPIGSPIYTLNDPTVISGIISGAGNLTFIPNDVAIELAGANTYTGPTTINGSTGYTGQAYGVVLESGSNLGVQTNGTGAYPAVTANGFIIVDNTTPMTINNPIGGTGDIYLRNGAPVTFAGNNTISNFFFSNGSLYHWGGVTVLAGNSSGYAFGTYTSTTFYAGDTVGGVGTIAQVLASFPGTLAPGETGSGTTTTGTLTIGGISSTVAGSVFDAYLNGSSSASVASSGTIALGSGLMTLNVALGSTALSASSYTIISGGTVTGTFAGLPTSGSVFTAGGQIFTITYNSNSVVLNRVTSSFTNFLYVDANLSNDGTLTNPFNNATVSTNEYTSLSSANAAASGDPVIIAYGSSATDNTAAVLSRQENVVFVPGPSGSTYTIASLSDSSGVNDTLSISTGVTLALDNTSSLTLNAPVSGLGSLTYAGGSGDALTLAGANTYSGATTVNSGVLQEATSFGAFSPNSAVTVASAGTFNATAPYSVIAGLSGAGTVGGGASAPADLIINVANSSTNDTFSGLLWNGTSTGTLKLTKEGPGTETLSGAFIFGGGLISSVSSVNNVIGGNLALVFGSTATMAISTAAWSGGVATITAPNALTVGQSVTISGVPQTGYDGTFVVTSATYSQFTYALASNPGTYSSGGTISYTLVNSNINEITVAYGATLTLSGGPNGVGFTIPSTNTSGTSPAGIVAGIGTIAIISGNSAAAGSANAAVVNFNNDTSEPFYFNGNLIFETTGNLSTNTYTVAGLLPAMIGTSTITVDAGAQFATAADGTTYDGGTYTFDGNFDGSYTLNGSGTVNSSGYYSGAFEAGIGSTGDSINAGVLTIGSSGAAITDFNGSESSPLTINATLADGTAGSGVVTFGSGASSGSSTSTTETINIDAPDNTVGTIVDAGTLVNVNTGGSLGTGTVVDNGTGSYAGITLNSVVPVSVAGSISGSGNFTLAGVGGVNFDNTSPITVSPAITGSGGPVTVTGSSTVTLTGTGSSYSGATTVSSGTLLVNGTVTGSSVSVASAATLGGAGTISGTATVNGTLNPATVGTAGTITIGTLTFGSGSTFGVDVLSGSSADEAVVSGTATLTGATLTVNTPAGFNSTAPITIVHAGAISGTFSDGSTVTGTGGQVFQITYTGSNVTLTLLPTVTVNAANLPITASTITIAGDYFSTTTANNTVTFSGAGSAGIVGSVTSATATSLTVAITTDPTTVGALDAVVTVSGTSSGSAVQVATVIPVMTASSSHLAASATTLTIAGFGFDTTAGNDTVTFSNGGVTGTVTSATNTSLTVSLTGLSSLTADTALTATVTIDSVSNASAVQVATVAPVVNSSTASLFDYATTMVINGLGFDTNTGNDTVVFSNGVTGTVTGATSSSLTVHVTGLGSVASGTALTATTTVDGVSSGSGVQVGTLTGGTYIWAGSNSAGGSWDTPGNWSVGGVVQTVNYPHLAADTASFPTTVTGGTITLNGQEMVSSLASYGNLTFAAGSVGGSLWLGGSLSVSGGNPVFSVPMVLTSNLTLSNGAYDSFSITGPITQSGGSYGITANLGTNGDTITLTGANSLTGPLIVNGPGTGANGALDASPAGLGSESVTINSNANFAAVGDTPTFTNNITFDGTAQTLSGSEVKWTGNIANNTSTSLTINGGSPIGSPIYTLNDPTVISGIISGAGNLTFIPNDVAIELAGANTYTGPTTINGSTGYTGQAYGVVLESGSNLGVQTNGTGAYPAVTANGFIIVDNTTPMTINNPIGGTGDIYLRNGAPVTFAGNNTISNFFFSNGSLYHWGGVTVLAGNSSGYAFGTYTSTTFYAGDTVGGVGTIAQVLASFPGTLAPGETGSGTTTTGTLTIGGISSTVAGSVFDAYLNGSSSASVASSGTIALGSGLMTLNVALGSTALSASSYTIISGGTVTGTFAGLPTSGSVFTAGGQIFTITYNSNSVVLNRVTSSFTNFLYVDANLSNDGTLTNPFNNATVSTNEYTSLSSANAAASGDPVIIAYGSSATDNTAAVLSRQENVVFVPGPSGSTYTIASLSDSSGVNDTLSISTGVTLALDNTSSLTLNAPVSGLGSLTYAGGSGDALTLAGANTYSGATTVNSGVLQEATSFGAFSPNSAVTVASAGTFNATAPYSVIAGLSGAGTVGGGASAPADLIINVANSSTNDTFSGLLWNGTSTGTLKLTKEGPGTETLSGAFIFGGGLISSVSSVNNVIGGNLALVFGSTATMAISTAAWSGGVATITAPNALTVGQSVTISGVPQTGYDGTFVVTSATYSQFTYALASNPGTYSSGGTISYTLVNSNINEITVAYGATLTLSGGPNGVGFTIPSTNTSGTSPAGIVAGIGTIAIISGNSAAAGSANAAVVNFNNDTSEPFYFNGNLIFETTGNLSTNTYTVAGLLPAMIGTSTITVDAGAQFATAADGTTYDGGTYTFDGNFDGSYTLNGSGTVNSSGYYSGAFEAGIGSTGDSINAGVLTIGSSGAAITDFNGSESSPLTINATLADGTAGSGVVTFGSGASSGSSTSTTETINIDAPDNTVGTIVDAGTLVNVNTGGSLGTGTVVDNGTGSYAGITLNSVVPVSVAGSISGSGNFTLAGVGGVNFDNTSPITVSVPVSGSGPMAVSGGSSVGLTTNSSSYTGAITVSNNSTLLVGATVDASTLTLSSGSAYTAALATTGTGEVAASGTATLTGATLTVNTGNGYFATGPITILHANSISGNFNYANGATVTGSGGQMFQISYTSTTVTLTPIPAITSSTAGLPANSTSITINGGPFDTTASNDTVTFNNGVTGTVTSATGTSLTVSLTGLSSVATGTALTATVTVDGVSSGSAVQVAAVAAVAPVVTASSANLSVSSTSLTIAGFGFDRNTASDVVALSNGVTGTVTAATSTSLAVSVTGLSILTGGTALDASVTVDSVSSGSAVQVAIVAPVVTSSTANLPGNAVSLTISGQGFDANTAHDSVTFDNGVTGTVTAATSTSLTVSLTGLSAAATGALHATVTVDGVSSGSSVEVAAIVPVVTLNSITSPTNENEPTFTGTAGTVTGDMGTITVKIYSGASVTGTLFETLTTTASGSSYSVTATASLSPDGIYTAQASQSDSSGQTGTSSTATFTVDTTAPTSHASSPAYNNTNSFIVGYTSSDATSGVSEVQVYVSGPTDGGTYSVAHTFTGSSLTSGGFTYTATEGDGSYKFETKATDAAGNVETTHASADTITIEDTVKPTSSAGSPTYNNTDSFAVGYTSSDATSGVSEVQIYVSGPTDAGTYSLAHTFTGSGLTSGSFTYTATEGDGSYKFETKATDAAGNVETTHASADTITIEDTVAPTSLASSPAYNNTDSFSVGYTSSDATSGVSEVQVYVSGPTDSGTYHLAHTFTGSGLTSGSFTYTATEGDGSYKFETKATDAAGNVETTHASADTTTIEDTVSPTSSAHSPAYNNTDSFSVGYTSSDATSGVSEVQVYVSGPTDGGTYSLAHTFTGSGLTSGSFAYTATEGDGSYEFETKATDAVGNVEATHASADTTTIEDTVAPTSSASSPAYNNTNSFTVSYTSSDATSGVSEVQVYVSGPTDGGTYSLAHTFTGSGLTSGSFTYTATEGDGSYEFETKATDAAGNVETTHASADTTTIEDTIAPTSLASSPAYNNTNSFTVSYTSSDATSGVGEVQVYVSGPTDGGTYSLAHTFTGSGLTSGSFTYTATEGDGSYEFETQATDAAGNVETTHASFDTTTVEDTVAPTSLASSPAYNNTNSFTVSYTSSDATSGVSQVQVYVSGPTDGGTYSLAHTFTGSGLTSGSFAYTATEGDGSYEFETQATDAAGNVETTHASADTTTVEDTVAPTVTLNSVSSPTSNTTPTFSGTAGTASGDLSTITVDVYSGASATGSPVEILTATASGGSYSVAATAALSLGTYTAQASQSDAAGNTGTSTSSTFTVQSSITSTTTNLTDNGPSPSTTGQAVSYTVNTTGVPNGATIYLDDANQEDAQVGTVVITGGTGSTTVSSLSVGTHEIFAVYGGDLTHASSQSGQVAQVVSNSVVTTTTSLTDNGPSPSIVGTGVSYTVSTTGVPNGSTVYLEDADHSNAVVGSVVVSGGTGSTTVSNLSIGSHSIFAVYTGAAGYTASQSTPSLAQTVSPIAVTSVAVNGDFIAISDLSEASQTVTVTTDGLNGFTAGNKVVIAGETGTAAGYNGTWTILSASGDTFTYTNSATGLPTLTFNANGYAISTNTSSSLRGSQRSMVDSVVYTFNAPVNLTSNAVTLALKGGITVTGPNTMATGVANVNWTSLSGGKIWVMTFSSASGNTVTGHSIADGVYTLSLNSADVTAVAGGSTMTTTRATDTFYRLYADTNGQQRVSNADLLAFNNCYAQEAPSESYLAALDYNADGRVNNTDLLAFNNHYSAHWTGFTSTI